MNPFYILEVQLSVICENIIHSLGGTQEILVKKDDDHYRLNISVNDKQIGNISINGKGLDDRKYLPKLIDICCKYLKESL